MPEGTFSQHVEHFLSAAIRHPSCHDGTIIEVNDASAVVELVIGVELPLHMKAVGASPNGVQRTESIRVELSSSYPWSSPTFFLRSDFPRDLPHLQPGAPDELPKPCLIDGNQREYFFQFGLLEAGIFHFVHQLALWLQRAAEGTLISANQGWEPVLRQDLKQILMANAEACRSYVDRSGGHRIFKADFTRSGDKEMRLSAGAITFFNVSTDIVPLKRGNAELFNSRSVDETAFGSTICCLVWPEKMPSGAAFVSDSYQPETITTLGALKQRAGELRCRRSLDAIFNNLERFFQGFTLRSPIPIGVILCARRPFNLINCDSNIELLPYMVELRADENRTSLVAAGDDEPVAPAMQLDVVNPVLLRRVSSAPEIDAIAMLGCGSVGSKMAMHLARAGVPIPVVSDQEVLLPHNMARHALACPAVVSKSDALARELAILGQSPKVHKDDLVSDLATKEGRRTVLPKGVAYALNTTASLGVREALSNLESHEVKPRLAEAALFGCGHGGFLLLEGDNHNPTLCDLVAELYATISDDRLRSLMFDPKHGLAEVQIGQGCGSLTMPMTDMRLSAMTASLAEALVETITADNTAGQIVVGSTGIASADTCWSRQSVNQFETVPIGPGCDWTLRISQRVLERVRTEIAEHPLVETGGVLVGMCSARLKAITVVDLLPAPPDSVRSQSRFILGTSGLSGAIKARHESTGGALFDIGTWHSHLADEGPSPLDRETAKALAVHRPPPSVLLIVTPVRLLALMHTEEEN